MTPQEIKYMKETIAADLIGMLMDDYQMDIKSAFESLYTSETYAKLSDTSTGLYFQSSGYVYSYLKTEMVTGRLSHDS